MKIFVMFLIAGALVFGGGCKKTTSVTTAPAVTNQVEQAAASAPQPATAPRQNIPAPAATPPGSTPEKLPVVP